MNDRPSHHLEGLDIDLARYIVERNKDATKGIGIRRIYAPSPQNPRSLTPTRRTRRERKRGRS